MNEKKLYAKLVLIPPRYYSDDFRGITLSEKEKETQRIQVDTTSPFLMDSDF